MTDSEPAAFVTFCKGRLAFLILSGGDRENSWADDDHVSMGIFCHLGRGVILHRGGT